MKTQTLNVRINKDTKKQAQRIVEKMGLDLSSAIKLFLTKVIQTKSIPFEVGEGRMTNPQYIKELTAELEWAKKNGKRYSSARELFDDLNS